MHKPDTHIVRYGTCDDLELCSQQRLSIACEITCKTRNHIRTSKFSTDMTDNQPLAIKDILQHNITCSCTHSTTIHVKIMSSVSTGQCKL